MGFGLLLETWRLHGCDGNSHRLPAANGGLLFVTAADYLGPSQGATVFAVMDRVYTLINYSRVLLVYAENG